MLIVGDSMAPAMAQTTFACLADDSMTEGPYWVDEQLNRADIRQDPSNNTVKRGKRLTLKINVYQSSANGCVPLSNAMVDIWHCDAGGLYSDEAANNTVGQKFLRGFQMTDSNGTVNFTTIYPGWYNGRTVHIHVRVRTYSGSTLSGQFVSQFFFAETVNDSVLSAAPYNTRGSRDTRNANDMVYTGATHPDRSLVTLTKTADGFAASINSIVTLDNGTTTTPGGQGGTRYAVPHLSYGGGWYSALYLTNVNSSQASVTVSLVGEDGRPLQVPGLAGPGGPGGGPGGPGGGRRRNTHRRQCDDRHRTAHHRHKPDGCMARFDAASRSGGLRGAPAIGSGSARSRDRNPTQFCRQPER